MSLSATPYADMAEQLGVSEEEVLQSIKSLQDRGVISLEGKMVERLHLEMAERLIEKAERIEARQGGDQET